MRTHFNHFARWTAKHAGHPIAFILALAVIVIWAAAGPFFDWSVEHSFTVNSVTTIVTFLMVFLIQNTQTRDTEAIQLKIDELILASDHARNLARRLEQLDEDEAERIKARCRRTNQQLMTLQ